MTELWQTATNERNTHVLRPTIYAKTDNLCQIFASNSHRPSVLALNYLAVVYSTTARNASLYTFWRFSNIFATVLPTMNFAGRNLNTAALDVAVLST